MIFSNWTTWIKNLDVSNFISKYDLIIPNINNLEKFNKILTESKNKIQINWLQIQTLSNLRDSLLPRLMSGKIRVV
jgi:type I restriction enzyme S subunit